MQGEWTRHVSMMVAEGQVVLGHGAEAMLECDWGAKWTMG